MKNRFTVYGLFDSDGRAAYVGQTGYPEARCYAHSISKRFRGMTFKRLRFCRNKDHAMRVEAQVISAYKKRGQAEFNKQVSQFKFQKLYPHVERITFYVDPELHIALRKEAKAKQLPRAALIRMIILRKLEELEQVR